MMMLFLYCIDNLTPMQQMRFELQESKRELQFIAKEWRHQCERECSTIAMQADKTTTSLRNTFNELQEELEHSSCMDCPKFLVSLKHTIEKKWITTKVKWKKLKIQFKRWLSAC